MVTEAEPLLPAKQETLESTAVCIVGPPILETAAAAVAVQPFASVAVIVYEPLPRLLMLDAEDPVDQL
jgi:hypothetical protein